MEKIFKKNLLRILSLSILILLLFSCKKDKTDDFDSLDLLSKIKTLEGVTVTEIPPQNGYPREFQIDIIQPIDHNNPNGAKFTQRAYLSHVDETKPMIFAPNGYRSTPSSGQEIAGILQTNCLNVTHRYFLDSRPDPLDWQYLTIQQAAADHHAIVALFKKIYKGKWISSGASKSGLASLFHRRYYPNDVDATIAYVAPFTFGIKDERYPTYLRNIGSSGCFDKLKAIQQYVLKHRADFLPLINTYIQSSSSTYTMDKELLLELDIMDYPFIFWQYNNIPCSSIPDTTTSTPTQIFNHYSSLVPISNFSDNTIAYYAPYSYQAITELGAPAYETGYLSGLLKKVDPNASGNPNYELLAPTGISYNNFNSTTVPEIYSWLQNHGDRIIYIYGKNDPWSAGAIELTGAADAVFIMQNGANHLVKITQLDNPSLVYDALERWLGIQINLTKSHRISIDDKEMEGFRLNGN
ncbi:MAG: hypothetical protein HOO91_05060 [Bacteroidales bacterium]|nr:hypothetical protein [Bacteroidales bacterium]